MKTDFNQNRAHLQIYEASLDELKTEVLQRPTYYKYPKPQRSTFLYMKSDVLAVASMGRIVDNSNSSAPPLALFNSQKFSVY